ncbi:uncharacterized protein LOC120268733 [Dioscorea cayenensis subsp. rotundata]|uniref:Uncharacterized protein LOC120268733 n=1 Tax=Dioscorea cayennensis subsp. rotundata TaxID=55577 RepID=A0AB40BZV9_DIOCR|nr:uncharacterized protein LOC120268733 [Dioscorea cayenensis subsp. rotundata]
MPTFLNMSFDLDQITMADVIHNDSWVHADHNGLLSNILNFDLCNLCDIDPSSNNRWVWYLSLSKLKISANVYHTLNNTVPISDHWSGWKKLRSLKIAPRIKHFIWLIFMGRLPTTDHLFNINLGPDTPCALCGLHRETIEHLFVSCPKIQPVWNYLSTRTNRNISFPDNFSTGSWITGYNHSLFVVSLIVACAWFHWKNRCDVIFRNAQLNSINIVCKAWAHANDCNLSTHSLLGRKLISNNFSWASGHFLFTYTQFQSSRMLL